MLEDFLEQEISVFGLRSKIKDLDPKYWYVEVFRNSDSFSQTVRGFFKPLAGEGVQFAFNITDIEAIETTNKQIADSLSFQITKAIKDKFDSTKQKDMGEYEQKIYDLEMTLQEYEKADAAMALQINNDSIIKDLERKLRHYNSLIYDNEALYDQIALNNQVDKYKLFIKKFRNTKLNNVIDFNKVLKKFGITREAV